MPPCAGPGPLSSAVRVAGVLVRIASGRGRRALAGCAAAALALLALLALGPAGTLLLIGGARCRSGQPGAPGSAGPVSWAAGVLTELGLLAAGSLALSTLSPASTASSHVSCSRGPGASRRGVPPPGPSSLQSPVGGFRCGVGLRPP